MEWDAATYGQLHEAFDAGRTEQFRRLLATHPEYLRESDGTDRWMWRAAIHGKLPIIQALVEVGMDVNEDHSTSDPNDPFYAPEGAIVEAASKGHLEVVRWLLDHGARINYVVHGQPRC